MHFIHIWWIIVLCGIEGIARFEMQVLDDCTFALSGLIPGCFQMTAIRYHFALDSACRVQRFHLQIQTYNLHR